MKAVGIKRLKAQLSEYVRLVKSGETVLVMERDEVVAELRPVRRAAPPPSDVEEALERMAERGELTRAAVPKEKGWLPQGLRLPAGTATKLLDELRADRDE